MKAFLDVNVLLDVVGEREPHLADSARVWALAETRSIDASVSVMSLPIAFYVMRRSVGAAGAWAGVRLIRDVFTLVPTDEQIIHQALDCGMPDFENAIQFFSALRAGAAAMITRNAKHFPAQDLAIQTPGQFLATHFRGE